MSIEHLQTALKALSKGWANRNRDLVEIVKSEDRNFSRYSEPVQAEALQKKRAEVQAEALDRLESIKKEILSEKKSVLSSIGRVKYPASSNLETSVKALGEMQILGAHTFLSRQPSSKEIVNAVKSALDFERVDFASTLVDLVSDRFANPPRSEEEKQLQAEINSLGETFPGKSKLDKLEEELQTIAPLESLASELRRFIESGHTGEFFSRSEVTKMKQVEVDLNLPSINQSMSVWSNEVAV